MIGAGELALILTLTILLFMPEFLDRKRTKTVHRLGLYAVIILLLLAVVTLSKLVLRLLSVTLALVVLVTAMALILIRCLMRGSLDHNRTKNFQAIFHLSIGNMTLGRSADSLRQGFLRQC